VSLSEYNEKDFELLTENTYADGALKGIFGPVKDSLKKYGGLLKDSAKLIGNDIGALIGLTFGRLKDPKATAAYMRDYSRTRENLVSKVTSASAELFDSWPDGKITSMMIAPGAFFATSAISGMGSISSKEFRASVGSFGFDKVPPFNLVFNDEGGMGDVQFWEEIKSAISDDDWEGSGERLSKKLEAIISGGAGRESKTTLFQKINKIFLWSHHSPSGTVLKEADEEDVEGVKKKFYDWVISEIEKNWPIDRDEFLKLREKEMSKIIDDASKVISLNSMLASCTEHEEFFKILRDMDKAMGEESEFDVSKVESEFTKMGKKLKDDEKSMKALKDEFEKNKEEPTEEKITAKISEIVLDQFKGQFLPKLKDGLIDYYDDVYDMASDKLEKSQLKALSEHEYGKKLVAQIKEHKKKIDEALSNLERN